MATAATKQKVSEIWAEATNTAKKVSVQEKPQAANDEKFANITSNPLHAIFTNKQTTPSQKQAAVAAYMEATEDKQKNRAAKAMEAEFRAWLDSQRLTRASLLLDLINKGVFSAEKKLYANMGQGLIEFNESMKDLTDILEGLNELRIEGKTIDAYAEIKKDGEERIRREKILKEQAEKSQMLLDEKERIERAIAQQGQNTRFLIGGLTKSARESIAQLEIDARKNEENITSLITERETTQKEFAENPPSQLGEKLMFAKEQLRQLLELSDEEHDGRQARLVTAAKTFIANTKTDTAKTLELLGGQGNQFVNLEDIASELRAAGLILHEGTKDAKRASQDKFASLESPKGTEESEIARMEREDKQAAIREHITSLEGTSANRITMLKEISELQTRAISMREINDQEIENVTEMNSSGVSAAAERLVTVINGVNSAALHQGAEATRASLEAMKKSTHSILTKGVVATAFGVIEGNNRLIEREKEIDELATHMREAKSIMTHALTDRVQIQAQNEAALAQLKGDMEDYLRSAAVIRDDMVKEAAEVAAPAAPKKSAAPVPGASLFG